MRLAVDQYHRATPDRLAHAVTTEHPHHDPRDTHGPTMSQLDRLRDCWTAAGLTVDWPAVGTIRACDDHGHVVKIATARDTDTHHPMNSCTATDLAACTNWPAMLRSIRTTTRKGYPNR